MHALHTVHVTHTAVEEFDSTTDACEVRAFCCPHPSPWGHPHAYVYYTHTLSSTLHTTAPPANHLEQNNQTNQSQRQDHNNWWLTGGISMGFGSISGEAEQIFSPSRQSHMHACGRQKKMWKQPGVEALLEINCLLYNTNLIHLNKSRSE